MSDEIKGRPVKTYAVSVALGYEGVEEAAHRVASAVHELYQKTLSGHPGMLLSPGRLSVLREPLFEGLIFRTDLHVLEPVEEDDAVDE